MYDKITDKSNKASAIECDGAQLPHLHWHLTLQRQVQGSNRLYSSAMISARWHVKHFYLNDLHKYILSLYS